MDGRGTKPRDIYSFEIYSSKWKRQLKPSNRYMSENACTINFTRCKSCLYWLSVPEPHNEVCVIQNQYHFWFIKKDIILGLERPHLDFPSEENWINSGFTLEPGFSTLHCDPAVTSITLLRLGLWRACSIVFSSLI